ncbi:hypothetical protein [Nocardia flavorosea]|uniref:hypothetical protein n=1 Tax=Nocardia flavorosea TaxID=53429 RepID=UPI0024579A04|nr:hypothetical protein [Nocardia flavorosea]
MNNPPPPGNRSPRGSGLEMTGWAMAGAFVFIVGNAVYGFAAFLFAGTQGDRGNPVIIGMATVLGILVAFGGGALLIRGGSTGEKGFGMGMMIGWALVTICTVGFCTGVNPDLYNLAAAGASR